jgi:hypothetical protein
VSVSRSAAATFSGQFSSWPPRGLAALHPPGRRTLSNPNLLRQRATTVRLPPPLFHQDSSLFFSFLLTPHLPTTRSIDYTSATRRSVVCRPSRGPFLSLKPLCSLDFCLVSTETNLPTLCRFRRHEIFSSVTSFPFRATQKRFPRQSHGITLKISANRWLLSRVPFATSCRIRSLYHLESVLQAPVFEHLLIRKYVLLR